VRATQDGIVKSIDNRRLARIAKLAGAPDAKEAGLDLKIRLQDAVAAGQILFVLHAKAQGEMNYALTYLDSHPPILIEPV
jgi:thymidine phosphorylase